jgi:hypothetical protein
VAKALVDEARGELEGLAGAGVHDVLMLRPLPPQWSRP